MSSSKHTRKLNAVLATTLLASSLGFVSSASAHNYANPVLTSQSSFEISSNDDPVTIDLVSYFNMGDINGLELLASDYDANVVSVSIDVNGLLTVTPVGEGSTNIHIQANDGLGIGDVGDIYFEVYPEANPALDAFNSASDVSSMISAIEASDSGLSLGSDYPSWAVNDKIDVAQNLLDGRGASFADISVVQSSFDAIVAMRTPVANYNIASGTVELDSALRDAGLVLDLSGYVQLSPADQQRALDILFAELPSDGYQSQGDIQMAVYNAVTFVINNPIVADPMTPFNNAVDPLQMLTAIVDPSSPMILPGDFATWKLNDRLGVAADVLNARGTGFADLNILSVAFNDAFMNRQTLVTVNNATDTSSMRSAIVGTGAIVDLADFNTLDPLQMDTVASLVLSGVGTDGYVDANAYATTLANAIAQVTSPVNTLASFNAAATQQDMLSALTDVNSGIVLPPDFDTWKANDTLAVSNHVLISRPGGGFVTLPEIQGLFDNGVVLQRPIADVNRVTNTTDLQVALMNPDLMLTRTVYVTLLPSQQQQVLDHFMQSIPANGFVDDVAIQMAFDSAISYVTSQPTNQDPIIYNQAAPISGLFVGMPAYFDLTDHFSDPDNDGLTFSVLPNPSVTASLGSGGTTLTLTPTVTGNHTVVVRATDSNGAHVDMPIDFMNVMQPPMPPMNMPPTVIASAPITSLNVGDSNSFQLNNFFADPEGLPLSYSIETVNGTSAAFNIMNENELHETALSEGITTVTVRATDASGLSTTLTFTVEGVAQTPTTTPPSVVNPIFAGNVVSIPQGANLPIDLTPFFSDPEDVTLTYTVTATNNGVVNAIVNGNTLSIGAMNPGTASVTVRATDSDGLFVDYTFSATTTPSAPTNTPPMVTVNLGNLPSMVAGTSTPVDPSSLFTDAEDSSLDYSVTVAPSNVVNAYIDPLGILQVSAVNTGTATITLRATDDEGLFTEQTFTVNVLPPLPQNFPPFATMSMQGYPTSINDAPVTVGLNQFFADNEDTNLVYTVAVDQPGVISANLSGSSLTIAPVGVGTTNITVRATDSEGLFVEQTFNVLVDAPVNTAPFIAQPINGVIGLPVTMSHYIDLNLNFADNESGLTYTTSVDTPGVINPIVNGSMLEIRPLNAGVTNVTVTATDSQGLTATLTFPVAIAPIPSTNQPPTVVMPIPPFIGIPVSQPIQLPLNQFFIDPNTNDTLTYSVTVVDQSVASASVGVDGNLVINPLAVGMTPITVRATDSEGLFTEQTFPFEVSAPQTLPAQATLLAPATAPIGSEFVVGFEIGNAVDLYGSSFKLRYDPTKLEVVDADPVQSGIQILDQGFLNGTVVANSVDPINGVISFAESLTGDVSGVNGVGLLAEVRFRHLGTSPEASEIRFEHGDGEFLNSNNQPISVNPYIAVVQFTDTRVPVVGAVKVPSYHPLTDLSGFSVEIMDSNNQVIATATTDGGGYYDILLPEGQYTTKVTKEGYLQGFGTINVIAQTPLPGTTLTASTLTQGFIPHQTMEVTPVLMYVGDFVVDNFVDIRDIGAIAQHYETNVDATNKVFDVNRDNDRVDLRDVVSVTRNFGKQGAQHANN